MSWLFNKVYIFLYSKYCYSFFANNTLWQTNFTAEDIKWQNISKQTDLTFPGACSEYLKTTEGEPEESRVLGLVMVPGRHIVSIQIDDTTPPQKFYYEEWLVKTTQDSQYINSLFSLDMPHHLMSPPTGLHKL